MTVSRYTVTKVDNFDRAQSYTTTPAGEFGWTIADTSTAGTPTYLNLTEDGGAVKLASDAQNEAQNVCLYQNDVLPFDWAKIQFVEWTLKIPVTATTTETFVWGLGNARNDVIASITEKFLFKVLGSGSLTAVVIDTKDGTTAVTGTATGATLSTTYKKFGIDFTNGLSDVRAYVDGSRVASGTTFNMSALTAGNNCQLMAQIQKTPAADQPTMQITRVAIQYTVADGA
jgi:hypothetical protein